MAKSRYNSGGYSSSPNYSYNQPYGSYSQSYTPRYSSRYTTRTTQPFIRRYIYTSSYTPSQVTPKALYQAKKAVYQYKLLSRRAQNPLRYATGMSQAKQSMKNAYLQWLSNQPKETQLTGKMLICAKRTIRKQVLLALGKGGGGNKKPQYKPESSVRC
ncbi:MAG: hypothetical protein [Arizlama microvirus]|nr:MAG: hypothetical protein [Arizlama microvirus]